jgi:hypothetical protein
MLVRGIRNYNLSQKTDYLVRSDTVYSALCIRRSTIQSLVILSLAVVGNFGASNAVQKSMAWHAKARTMRLHGTQANA